ncbi:MAG: DNA-processing protein DprA [Alphaproteobacteria bacterium]|nr:DNA-processing protein DprA [Alphaproteobacteria bacterium]
MKVLSEEEKFARLKLTRSESIGVRLFWRLIKKYSSAVEVLNVLKKHSRENPSRGYKICEDSVVEKEIENTKKLGAEFLFFEDELYPPLLRETVDTPPVLTFLGEKKKLKEFNKRKLISIVGARNSSIMANKLCRQIAEDLGRNDVVIVSGMARGIDSEAHKASVSSGTIAVLASGIDIVYPPENRKLYDSIKESGIILAEMPFGTAPQGHLFPRRNRIIAGLSSGTVIIEAAKQSGSLITARYALEYNRDVFAVPGFPLDIRSEGGNNLLKQGAILTLSAQDILDHVFPQNMTRNDVCQKDFLFDSEEVSMEIDKSKTEEIHEKILNLLSFTPITIEELVSALELSPQEVLPVLMELEMENTIARISGQRVVLVRN